MKKLSSRKHLINTVLAALFLAMALVLPFLTGQIPKFGKMLCPMHIPVLLCGFICGPLYGALIGFVAPFLRFALFGMPAIIPDGVVMCVELLAYGLFSGVFYRVLPKKKINIYASLIMAQLAGRVVWGVARAVLYGLSGSEFGIKMFITVGFVNAAPGIVLQLMLIPIIVIAIEKAFPRYTGRLDSKA